METKVVYEVPTVRVVEIKMDSCILQTSYQGTTGGTIPGYGDIVII